MPPLSLDLYASQCPWFASPNRRARECRASDAFVPYCNRQAPALAPNRIPASRQAWRAHPGVNLVILHRLKARRMMRVVSGRSLRPVVSVFGHRGSLLVALRLPPLIQECRELLETEIEDIKLATIPESTPLPIAPLGRGRHLLAKTLRTRLWRYS